MAETMTTEDLLRAPPCDIGQVCLSVAPTQSLHWIAPWPGSEADVTASLQAEIGAGFPGPGQVFETKGALLCWAGRGAAFLMGASPPAAASRHGAVIDVSDGWIGLRLAGADAAQVMARVCPVDLRQELFSGPCALRTEIAHVAALVIAGRAEIEMWVMRSFATTVYLELRHAAGAVAARRSLTL